MKKHSIIAASTPASSQAFTYSLELKGVIQAKPNQVFNLLTGLGSNNPSIFRDIKKESKLVVHEDLQAGIKSSRVIQEGQLSVFPGQKKEWRTTLSVDEITTTQCLRYRFGLVESDLLSSLDGCWTLTSTDEGKTLVVLNQVLTPKGLPSFLRRVPFAGRAIQRMLVKTAGRQFEDLENACERSILAS